MSLLLFGSLFQNLFNNTMKIIIFFFTILSLYACNKEVIVPNTFDGEIERIAQAEIVMGKAPGVAIGIIKNGVKRTYNFGVQNLDSKEPFNEFTICEIGSISKTLTALLYAQLAEQHLIHLANPANQYLPANLQLPNKNNAPATVLHLLNHTSGLETQPQDLGINPNKNPQPFNYSEDKLAAYLKQTELRSEPGENWHYSNTGMGLLGRMLREITGKQVTELYKDNIFRVLGMQYSFSNNTEKPSNNVAQGYMGKKSFEFFEMTEVFQAAGCVKSNVHDMLLYLENLLDARSPIASSVESAKQTTFLMKREAQVIAGKSYSNLSMSLGWGKIQNEKGEWIFNHTGRTYGFTSFIAFNETQQTGVILLYNTGQGVDVSSVGFDILSALEKY